MRFNAETQRTLRKRRENLSFTATQRLWLAGASRPKGRERGVGGRIGSVSQMGLPGRLLVRWGFRDRSRFSKRRGVTAGFSQNPACQYTLGVPHSAGAILPVAIVRQTTYARHYGARLPRRLATAVSAVPDRNSPTARH